jgi:hypothetical protein
VCVVRRGATWVLVQVACRCIVHIHGGDTSYGCVFYLGREAGVGSLGGGITTLPILALACAVGKSYLVLVADQGAPEWLGLLARSREAKFVPQRPVPGAR